MKFWIVTPSYNQLNWLRLCVASVADQVGDGIDVHHHIQDARSSDGTPEWLAEYSVQQSLTDSYQLTFVSEADEGMYDAINRGWKLASDDVDVIAHLNCDEQYLPSALKIMAEFFKLHQKADVVLADMIVVDKDGEYICHRRSLKAYPTVSKYTCGGFTATTFQRATVTKQKGVFFDTSWRNVGDRVWYNALHRAGCQFAVCNQIVAVFADTGNNLNWTDEGLVERTRYTEQILRGNELGSRFFSKLNGLRRWLIEFMFEKPSKYSLYSKHTAVREERRIENPTGLWHHERPEPASRDKGIV